MRRTGLGRHRPGDRDAAEPLDGLVNLFDIGIVLAVAFLIAGIGLTVDAETGRVAVEGGAPTTSLPVGAESRPAPTVGPPASGRGSAIGTLYRLDDGRLVVVEDGVARTVPGGP